MAAVVIASCNESSTKEVVSTPVSMFDSIPELYYKGSDTTIVDSSQAFEKKSYRGTVCATGKQYNGTYWKLNGLKRNFHYVSQQGKKVPFDSIIKWKSSKSDAPGRVSPDVKNNRTSSSSQEPFSWDWLKKFLQGLLGIAILLICLWLLYHLAKWLLENLGRTSSTKTKSSAVENKRSGPNAPAFSAQNGNKSSGNENQQHGYEGAIALVEQLQQTGGKVTFGELHIDIPATKGVHINIVNDNTSTMGDILIDAKAEDNTTIITEDNRHFSRGPGKKEEEKNH